MMTMKEAEALPIPEEYRIPEETLLDIYYDATADYGFGDVKSEDAADAKKEALDALDGLIDTVREEGFRMGYQIGYMHGRDGLPDEDEDEEDDDEGGDD